VAGGKDPKYRFVGTPLVSYSLYVTILEISQPQNKTYVPVKNVGQKINDENSREYVVLAEAQYRAVG